MRSTLSHRGAWVWLSLCLTCDELTTCQVFALFSSIFSWDQLQNLKWIKVQEEWVGINQFFCVNGKFSILKSVMWANGKTNCCQIKMLLQSKYLNTWILENNPETKHRTWLNLSWDPTLVLVLKRRILESIVGYQCNCNSIQCCCFFSITCNHEHFSVLSSNNNLWSN